MCCLSAVLPRTLKAMGSQAMSTFTLCTLDGAEVTLKPDGARRCQLLLEFSPWSSQQCPTECNVPLSVPFYEHELLSWMDAWSDDRNRSLAGCASAVKVYSPLFCASFVEACVSTPCNSISCRASDLRCGGFEACRLLRWSAAVELPPCFRPLMPAQVHPALFKCMLLARLVNNALML